MHGPVNNTQSGYARNTLALQAYPPLPAADLAQDTLAAQTAGDDFGVIRWGSKIAKKHIAYIRSRVMVADQEAFSFQF
ncbi:hypothetical protein Q644_20570 [Brucella intermedia 229E]|uniref:Uncharacterized protein n=1 Tax=Brucella intermedia 229E TaxID=1337887 RepID=U4VFL0_9HYPH|nr:hypothetical protein Q644_20570 [Brucella intermedia 229E]